MPSKKLSCPFDKDMRAEQRTSALCVCKLSGELCSKKMANWLSISVQILHKPTKPSIKLELKGIFFASRQKMTKVTNKCSILKLITHGSYVLLSQNYSKYELTVYMIKLVFLNVIEFMILYVYKHFNSLTTSDENS